MSTSPTFDPVFREGDRLLLPVTMVRPKWGPEGSLLVATPKTVGSAHCVCADAVAALTEKPEGERS